MSIEKYILSLSPTSYAPKPKKSPISSNSQFRVPIYDPMKIIGKMEQVKHYNLVLSALAVVAHIFVPEE